MQGAWNSRHRFQGRISAEKNRRRNSGGGSEIED